MDHDAKTIAGRNPTAGPPPARALRSANRRPARRRIFAAVSLVTLTVSLIGGSYFLLGRVDSKVPEQESLEAADFRGHQAPVLCIAASPDGETVVSGDESGTIYVWNGVSRQVRFKIAKSTEPIISTVVSHDGELAAAGDEHGTIRVWNLKTQAQECEFFGHGGGVTDLAMHPTKNFLISCGRDKRVAIWNIGERKLFREQEVGGGDIVKFVLTPDALQLIAGDAAGNVRIWKLAALKEQYRFPAHSGGISDVAVSPLGGQIITCGKDGLIRRWDLDTRKPLGEWKPPRVERLTAVAYSPGATQALSVADGGTTRLWSLVDDRLLETYGGDDVPTSCATFFPRGSFVVAGSFDKSIRFWRTPPPSQLEIDRAADVVARAKLVAAKYERFAEHMRLGKRILDEKRDKEALHEFESAEASVEPDSLEYQAAHNVVEKLSRNIDALERYASLCKAGKAALEKEDFAGAAVRFQQAQDAINGLAVGVDLPEAREGLRTVRRIERLKRALDGLKITGRTIDFAEYATKRPLDRGREFAFLLTKDPPPMALAATPLEWQITLTTPTPFPDEDVKLRVQLLNGKGEMVAEVLHPFVADTMEQSFLGKAVPPAGGWPAGAYEIRATLLAPERKIEQEPQEFKIGRLNWTEKDFVLRPQDIHEAGYVFNSGIKVEKGDALFVSADGTVAPAPVQFYRELLSDNRLAAPVPAPPQGLAWSKQFAHIQKYRMVDFKSDYAALVMRVGYEGIWLPYKLGVPPLPMPEEGPLHFSINSIVPTNFSYAKPTVVTSNTETTYWAPNCGSFHVTVLHGRYEFPIALSAVQKGTLLLRYFGETRTGAKPERP